MSFSILFYLRKDIPDSQGNLRIDLRISTSKKDRTSISTGIKIKPEQWLVPKKHASNGMTLHIKGSTSKIKALNERLSIIETKLQNRYNELLKIGAHITARSLKEVLISNNGEITLMSISETLINNIIAKSTKETTTYRARRIQEFLQDEYGIKDLPISGLLTQEYRGMGKKLNDWCLYRKKYSNDVARLTLVLLKNIATEAVDLGVIEHNPINYNFKAIKEHKEQKESLILQEVLKIEKHVIDSKSALYRVRDCFLFQCFTGLAYIDTYNLNGDDLLVGVDKRNWIVKKRQKTKVVAKVPIIKSAQDILDRYAHNIGKYDGRLLPVYASNSAYNKYIKKLMKEVGIDKKISSHSARFTFAEILRTSGAALDNIKDVLGHSEKKMTEHYAKMTDSTISSELDKLDKSLEASR
ncbi:site-specific integrase [Microscilla marina]|nr:site-specific integrase [Microscilla marina]